MKKRNSIKFSFRQEIKTIVFLKKQWRLQFKSERSLDRKVSEPKETGYLKIGKSNKNNLQFLKLMANKRIGAADY